MKKNTKLTVHFNEVDHAQRIFFAKAFEWAHQIIEEKISASHIGWKNWFDHSTWAVPIVSAQAQFHRPVLASQILNCDLQLIHLGRSSLTFVVNFSLGSKLAFEVTTVHVFVNKKTQKKMPVPKLISSNLQKMFPKS